MGAAVTVSIVERIALIRIDNPPVNAVSHSVRAGLTEAIAQVQTNDDVEIAALLCSGKTFVAGANIREFGLPPEDPSLSETINAIENCSKPVVAVLHGTTLGVGMEIALGAHYRTAMPGTKLGLPEVKLGLIPGAGGTQRLPRLVGIVAALEIATTGAPISDERALELGLVDEITNQADPRSAAIAFSNQLLEQGAPVRSTGRLENPDLDDALAEEWKDRLAKSAKGQIAPLKCAEAVVASAKLSLTEGLALERKVFTGLMKSAEREALVHAFFAEREVFKLPEIEGVPARKFVEIGVIGGGTMGCGIAVSALTNGLSVCLIERDDESVERARAAAAKILKGSVRRGKLRAEQRDRILRDQFSASTDYQSLSNVDIVIEAVFENIDVKRTVFQQLDRVCKPGAILATNTSYLDVNAIADFTSRPRDVIGLHFFSPAHIMKLLEIVVGNKTATDAVATGFAFAKRLKKIPVRAGVCDGFIGNRILDTYRTHADHLVLEGASPEQVDRAIADFGFAMGPYAVSDLAGLDIGWATRKRKAPHRHEKERIARFADQMCENGWLGQKIGKGFYLYGEGIPRGTPNPDVIPLIEADRRERGIIAANLTDEEIVNRYMASMINEASKVIGDGIAARPLDVDVTMLNGYGFPRHRGGPMKYADLVGLDVILARIEKYAKIDPHFWQPAPLLVELVRSGRNFASLN